MRTIQGQFDNPAKIQYSPWTSRTIFDGEPRTTVSTPVLSVSNPVRTAPTQSTVGKTVIQAKELGIVAGRSKISSQSTTAASAASQSYQNSLKFNLTCLACGTTFKTVEDLTSSTSTCCSTDLIINLVKHSKKLEMEKTRLSELSLALLKNAENLKSENKELVSMSKTNHEFYQNIINILVKQPVPRCLPSSVLF